ncbi:MAG: hypothetical protein KIT16_19130 [Rhodospirillaceae bacterium]|nr:hypothetical protein [Rhodospirillaceae bacterium]
MQRRRGSARNDRRPIIDVGSVVARAGGPVVSRGSIGGPIRRRGGGGTRFIVVVVLLVAAYFVVGSFRHDIVRGLPAAFPVLKALGYDVAEPVGYGLRLTGVANRARDENGNWIVYVRGRVANSLQQRASVPRIVLTVTSSNARPMVYTIEPTLTSLAPGQSTDFTARYPTPFALRDVRLKLAFEKR